MQRTSDMVAGGWEGGGRGRGGGGVKDGERDWGGGGGRRKEEEEEKDRRLELGRWRKTHRGGHRLQREDGGRG